MSSLIQDHVGGWVDDQKSPVSEIIDFGVMCGFPDYVLATRYPATQVVAIDRQEMLRDLNDQHYRRSNLRFVAGDILESLNHGSDRSSGKRILFHARTATVCYPEFLRKLYRKCAESSIDAIALIEFGGYSKSHLKFYDFAELPADSIAMRANMFIHNYPKLLSEAGYRVVKENRVTKPGLFLDLGLGECTVAMIAERI